MAVLSSVYYRDLAPASTGGRRTEHDPTVAVYDARLRGICGDNVLHRDMEAPSEGFKGGVSAHDWQPGVHIVRKYICSDGLPYSAAWKLNLLRLEVRSENRVNHRRRGLFSLGDEMVIGGSQMEQQKPAKSPSFLAFRPVPCRPAVY